MKIVSSLLGIVKRYFFPGSALYWEKRYTSNGNSGAGSYGASAAYKADILNKFIVDQGVKSAVEFGCGDGNQLTLLNFTSYVGFDVSNTIIKKCRLKFKGDEGKRFYEYSSFNTLPETSLYVSDVALSLDVVYHLVEDHVYEDYMKSLFSSSTRFVIIYAWDVEGEKNLHVKHRKFTDWIRQNITNFSLKIHLPSDKGYCDFVIYEKIS